MIQKNYFPPAASFFRLRKKNRSFKVSTSAPTRLESCDLALKLNESLVGVTKLRKTCCFSVFFNIILMHAEMEVVYGGRTSQRAFFSNYEICKIRISYITYIFCDGFLLESLECRVGTSSGLKWIVISVYVSSCPFVFQYSYGSMIE